MSKTLGVFGGSFDPFHNGHLHVLTHISHHLSLRDILIVPAYQSPTKNPTQTSTDDRINMCKLAISDFPHYRVWDWEARQERPSFTYRSIERLQFEFPDYGLVIIVGSDAAENMPNWANFSQFISQISVAIIRRENTKNKNQILRLFPKSVQNQINFVDVAPVSTSSSSIRNKIHHQLPILDDVHPKVAEYIIDKKLYQA